ncbi:MAG: ABC transporter permease [Bacteroidota bacterium]
MNKIPLIARSEYLRRVRTKAFVIATLLAPIALLALVAVSVWVGIVTQEGGARTVAVVDETGELGAALSERLPDNYAALVETAPLDSLRARVERGALDGYFVLPERLISGDDEAAFYSEGVGGFSAQMRLQRAVEDVVRRARLRATGASDDVLRAAESGVDVRMVALTEEGEAEDTSWVYSGLGYAMGFVIYIAMFVYGAMVMRGVIEEKTNRIIEVVASSAKPFQLMMGKVLGIGAVGLTQFVLWVVLALAGLFAAGAVLGALVDPAALAGAEAAEVQDLPFDPSGFSLADIPFDLIVYFLLFFLGGYLLYGSLFAAVGSAVEQESDAQSLQTPLYIPIILPALFLPFIADNPDAPMSVVLSLVPFFSPILMVVRAAATDVPFWQMALALTLLAAAFVGTIWLASRIYRVGILMYGKKASFRDLARWVRYA